MADKKCIVFDIHAPFATFRDPSTSRGYITFPFPPKTAILGLLGAIMGEDHNVIYRNSHPLQHLKIGIEILKQPSQINFKTNQLQTKYPLSFNIKKKRVVIGISTDMKMPLRSPQNLVLLKDAQYRIYVIFDEDSLYEEKTEETETGGQGASIDINECRTTFFELRDRIHDHRYYYPPYMGRANLLAGIRYIDTVPLERIVPDRDPSKNEPIETSTLCANECVQNIVAKSYSLVTNVPNNYEVIESKMGRNTALLVNLKKIINVIYFIGTIEVVPKYPYPYYKISYSSNRHINLEDKIIIPLP